MAKRVVWSGHALADVTSIASYIASDSPAYARIVVKKIA
ncbi:MAG TPA: type II toxin-antitoxin system RelE/ParE family toxin, partial [Candidatus Angelobacter sp.]|nr:type II toxin-antitoxin system RelE/ParE family toxin [Candidatus Angelobacter sp.]